MTGIAEEGTGSERSTGGGSRPARRGLDPLKPEVFENHPHKLALVEHLRSLIEAANLSSKQVASGVILSASTVSRNLSGERLPHRSTVEAIIQLCGASEEVRALSLRLHTAALREADPEFAERLAMADAYEETVLLHDQVQARLQDALGEHRRHQADYDDLLARHETTSQALATTKEELRAQRQHHQEETARLNTLHQEQQEARRRDRAAFDTRLDQVRSEHEEQLRAREEEETRLRQDLLAQENKIRALAGLLEDSAAESTVLRQERDRLRVESARLREELVGLQVELAAAEAGRDNHADDAMLAPALLAVGQVLDRHPAPPEGGDTAGRPHVAGGATQHGNPVAPPVAARPEPQPTDGVDGMKRASAGFITVGMVLVLIGPFLHTGGPMADSRPTTTGWWCIGSGVVLLITGLILMAVRDVKNARAGNPDDTYDHTYGFPPLM
ncbi:helix-turn-helix domain-containing protein [Streptomyces sp. NPDC096339]|uniref:helix-turn-helix domain-containing protein n=1 Tax=Streptomyces sp. NPDC096339 TaxID=3366086 RepID=UPI003804B3C5